MRIAAAAASAFAVGKSSTSHRFVSNEHVDRSKLGHAAKGMRDEESGLLSSVQRILAADEGELVLLKGEAWPDNGGRGAVHRSPAVSDATPRLVLTLDPL